MIATMYVISLLTYANFVFIVFVPSIITWCIQFTFNCKRCLNSSGDPRFRQLFCFPIWHFISGRIFVDNFIVLVVKPEKQRYLDSSSIWNHPFPMNYSEISNEAINGKFWKWSLIIRHDITIGTNFVRIVDKYITSPCLGLSAVEIRYQLWRDNKKSWLIWDVSHLSKSEFCCR